MRSINELREKTKAENAVKYQRQNKSYKNKLEVIKIKKDKLKEDPIYPYLEFVCKKVCLIMKVDEKDFFGLSRQSHVAQSRYFAIGVISGNTKLKADVMYFFNRDRTTWYSAEEAIEKYTKSYVDKKLYEECKAACSMENFMKSVEEKGTQLYQ